eukprot:1192065-Ditylum_brightwellii.AAC.1
MTDEEKDNTYQRVHVTFQSASSCNIQEVNMLSSVSLFEDTKERGMGKIKHRWVLEMNEGQQLYLSIFYKVDAIDHFIKNIQAAYHS